MPDIMMVMMIIIMTMAMKYDDEDNDHLFARGGLQRVMSRTKGSIRDNTNSKGKVKKPK